MCHVYDASLHNRCNHYVVLTCTNKNFTKLKKKMTSKRAIIKAQLEMCIQDYNILFGKETVTLITGMVSPK